MSTIEDANLPADATDAAVGALGFRWLTDVLADRARRFANRNAYTFQGAHQDEVITFAELDQRARSIAAELQSTVQRGDRVLLLFHAGLDFITSFVGCLYAGVVAVPTTYPKPRRPMPRLVSIANGCQASMLLTDAETLSSLDEHLGSREYDRLHKLAVDTVSPNRAAAFEPVEGKSSDLAFLQFTSGSTSEPRGVMVSHGNLLHNLEMIRQGFGLRAAEDGGEIQTGVFWLPAYHDMGLIGGILETMYVGGHSVLMSPAAFLQRPMGWLENMSEYGAAISGAPNFAFELCVNRSTDEQRRRLNLSNWKVAFCGAEPIRPGTLLQFAEAFSVSGFRESAFYPCFGLAEGTLLAAGGRGPSELTVRCADRNQLAENRFVEVTEKEVENGTGQALVGCGSALLGQRIEIVDPATNRICDSNQVGEIWLQGPSVGRGYWGRPDESEYTFGARIQGEEDGTFLRSGDLGFIADGHLFVTGRVKDVIIIRGRNHYPQDIERTASQAHEALRQDSGAVFTTNDADGEDRLVIVHEIDRQYRKADFDQVIRAVRRAVGDVHELELHSVVLIRHMSLPRTTSGKVQRHLCRQQLESGDLKVLAEWSKQSSQQSESSSAAAADSPKMNKPTSPMTADEIDRLAERIEIWLLNWLKERAAIPDDELHRDKPFAEYGLDSLTAVELSHELEDWVGVEVMATVAWNYPTIAALSKYLASASGGQSEESSSDDTTCTSAEDEFARLLSEIETLSEADAHDALVDESDR